MTSTETQPQTTLYEKVIEDEAVEDALERREKIRQRRRALNKEYREADAVAKSHLNTLDLGADAPVRIGRFVVSLRKIEAKSVSFEVEASQRLAIRPIEDAA